eukprot:3290508-Amphidinium_carterae.1
MVAMVPDISTCPFCCFRADYRVTPVLSLFSFTVLRFLCLHSYLAGGDAQFQQFAVVCPEGDWARHIQGNAKH